MVAKRFPLTPDHFEFVAVLRQNCETGGIWTCQTAIAFHRDISAIPLDGRRPHVVLAGAAARLAR